MSTTTSTLKRAFAAFALSLAALTAPAQAGDFDGTWNVSLVSSGGMCGSGSSSVLTVRNGSVRGGSGVSVSGQVGPSGSVSLSLNKSGISGSASGRLSGTSGSGSWSVASLGCSGHWTARRA
jgi:hypothetical protein